LVAIVTPRLNGVLNTLVEERWDTELMYIAIHTGCMPIVQRLFDAAQNHPELANELLRGYRSIEEGALGNPFEVVELLSEEDEGMA
jgi:hypothetical protein